MRCLAGRLFRLRLVIVFLFVAALAILRIMWKLPYYDISHLNDFRTFRHQWCRMHEWRVDWEGMVKPCENRVAWTRREINSELRSDAWRSFITKWEILPAGERKNTKPKSGPVCKHRMLPYDQISCNACKILAKVVDYH